MNSFVVVYEQCRFNGRFRIINSFILRRLADCTVRTTGTTRVILAKNATQQQTLYVMLFEYLRLTSISFVHGELGFFF